MSKFADRTGHEWEIEVTAGHLKRLRVDHKIDLRDALKSTQEGNSVATAVGDPEQFGALLWTLCEEQAEKAGIEPEDFAYLFNGEATRRAVAGVWEAIFDFFHGGKAAEKAGTAFRKGMDQADQTLATVWEKAGDSLTSKNSAANSADVQVSTPAATA